MGALLLVLVWAAYAFLVPALIRVAYRGESLPLLSQLMDGRGVFPVEFHLDRWRVIGFRAASFATALALLTLPLVFTAPWSGRFPSPVWTDRVSVSFSFWMWIIAALSFVLILFLFYVEPVSFVLLAHEDYWAEWAASFFFFAAFIYLLFAMFSNPKYRKPGYIFLALATFLVAGEEFSWGQRILELKPPEFFAHNNLQREINLHNLAPHPPSALIGAAILLWAWAIPWGARRLPHVRERLHSLGIPIPPSQLRPLFYVSAFLFFLSHAPFLTVKLAELGEVFLGCAVACLSLYVVFECVVRAFPERSPSLASYTGSLLLVVWLTTSGFLAVIGPPANVERQLHWYAIDVYPTIGLYWQSEQVFQYLERHDGMLSDTTLLEAARIQGEAGNPEAAAELLERALERAQMMAETHPEDPGPTRAMMVAYSRMGREQEAEVALRTTMQRDTARLTSAETIAQRALVRWSMATTLFKAERPQAALAELTAACDSLVSTRIQRVAKWGEENFASYVIPATCARKL